MPAGAREVQDAGTPVGLWLGQGSLTRFHKSHSERAPPGPAGKGSEHRAVGGAWGCSFPLEEPVTSILCS